jgi:predicted transcriptional regulator
MEQVWSAGEPLRVRDVLIGVSHSRPLAYTTVQTVMEVLHRKGWLTRSRQGRANIYRATGTREDYVAALLAEALTQTEDRSAALLRFFEAVDPVVLAELRESWDHARSGGHGL